jgi:hypothetical protein
VCFDQFARLGWCSWLFVLGLRVHHPVNSGYSRDCEDGIPVPRMGENQRWVFRRMGKIKGVKLILLCKPLNTFSLKPKQFQTQLNFLCDCCICICHHLIVLFYFSGEPCNLELKACSTETFDAGVLNKVLLAYPLII